MQKIEVELWGFGSNGEIREVEAPDWVLKTKLLGLLERAFYYGQNDIQPKKQRSVSVGDVVRWKGRRFIARTLGFEEIEADYVITQTDWTLGLQRVSRDTVGDEPA